MSAPGSAFPNLTDADIASLRSSGLTDTTIAAMGCYLWLLERCEAASDRDVAAHVKASAQLAKLLSALHLAASGSSDMALAIAVANSNRESLAKRDGAAWMTYDSKISDSNILIA